MLWWSSSAFAALPEPPHQHDPWEAPRLAGLDEAVPALIDQLFEIGFADPRGGEYRAVELRVKDAEHHWRQAHAWYFPSGIAVGWDGLVYPVKSAGEPADLVADVDAHLARTASSFRGGWPFRAGRPAAIVALLARVGRPELAERMAAVLDTTAPGISPLGARVAFDQRNWLAMAVTDWLSDGYHAAVEAHAVGDDQFAVDAAETLVSARARFEQAWAKTPASPNTPSLNHEPLAFLDPLPVLRADSARRLATGTRPVFDPAAL